MRSSKPPDNWKSNSNDVNMNNNNNEDEFDDIGKLGDVERLQKVLSRAGIASRRDSEKLILDGSVSVNGNIVTELGVKVNHKKDIIMVNNKKVVVPDAKATFWVALHKPKDMLTTSNDDQDRDTITDLVPKAKELRLLPVGRLDRHTTGLMIMTNDNGWIFPLTHPSFEIKKRHDVIVTPIPTEEDLIKLRDGGLVLQEDITPLAPVGIQFRDIDKPNNLALLDILIEESQRPDQIERMMKLIKCTVVSMKRTEFGPIKLGGLKRGEWKELTANDVQKLKNTCKTAALITQKRKADGSGKIKSNYKRDDEKYKNINDKTGEKKYIRKSGPSDSSSASSSGSSSRSSSSRSRPSSSRSRPSSSGSSSSGSSSSRSSR
jgi:23S rRNA pseudouridine2605 synthase